MAKAARRLGRGLDSLVSSFREVSETEPTSTPSEAIIERKSDTVEATSGGSGSKTTELDISDLKPNPFQPRRNTIDANITQLAESIRASGLLQPVTVRSTREGYEIIAGERRWRAARQAGLKKVPVLIREATEQEMLELALIENIQREDLSPIDRALAYKNYQDQFGFTTEEIAEKLGEDRSTVSNYMRLLDLPKEIRSMVNHGEISMGHARSLLGVISRTKQEKLAQSVIENGLSVRALEDLVRRAKRQEEPQATQTAIAPLNAHIRQLERKLEDAVKTKISIKQGKKKGTGRIIIEYYTFDDFDRIAQMLGYEPE